VDHAVILKPKFLEIFLQTVIKRVAGQILVRNNFTALLVRAFQPESGANDLIYLRFTLVIRGSGDHIFPSFILDDWGREIRGLKLYAWLRENGERFPRGEVFGFEQDGRETQCFLREVELYARLPTYAYQHETQTVNDGMLLKGILLTDQSVVLPRRIDKPPDIRQPLKSALVNWWQVPAEAGLQDLDLLNGQPDPGY